MLRRPLRRRIRHREVQRQRRAVRHSREADPVRHPRSGLSDVVCVVARYFGGTLLGTGGLVHAYTEAATTALGLVDEVEMAWCRTYTFVLDYDRFSRFPQRFRDITAGSPSCDYSDRVSVTVHIREADADRFIDRMSEFGEGRIELEHLGHSHQPIPASRRSRLRMITRDARCRSARTTTEHPPPSSRGLWSRRSSTNRNHPCPRILRCPSPAIRSG